MKCSDIYESQSFKKQEMPRFTLSYNQDHFDTLLNLCNRNDESSVKVWELIRMLATNQKLYKEVLNLQISENEKQDSKSFWKKFFESGSVYKQSYIHEIIEALMEEGEDLSNRVFFVGYQDISSEYVAPAIKSREKQVVDEESKNLK